MIIHHVVKLCRTYNPKEAIALDRFVYKLTGSDDEEIERKSKDSAMPIKDSGATMNMSVKS